MKRDISGLAEREFDVLVVGAGITGAWIALDCAQRGLDVALIDRADFGAETSAKSSKLLHGGIRYLQQFQFGRVRESARERGRYHQVAPHLSHYIPFLVPTYRDFRKGRLFLTAGMALYRLVCAGIEHRVRYDKRAPAIHFLPRDRLEQIVPLTDPDITGAFVLPESHLHSSERTLITIIKSAFDLGATAANYVAANGLLLDDGRVTGISATDNESGQSLDIRARLTINATGPWLSRLVAPLKTSSARTITTGFSVGSHLVTRQLIDGHALAIPTAFKGDSVVDRGGRHVFILPWRGHSLIGTSYVPAADGIDELRIQEEEIEQLVGSIQQALPELGLTRDDIVHSFSGIYPLQTTAIEHGTYQGTGEYQIIDHEAEGDARGLISSLGAKYTTARNVARLTVDLALSRLGKPATPCQSHRLPLAGGNIEDLPLFTSEKQVQYLDHLEPDTVAALVQSFGTGIDHVLRSIPNRPEQARAIGEDRPNTRAEIEYVVEHEMCRHLDDLLYRRTGIGTIGRPAEATLGACLDIMARHLAWDDARKQSERQRVLDRYVFDR